MCSRARLVSAFWAFSAFGGGVAASGCAPELRIDAVEPQPAAPGATITVAGAGFSDGIELALTSPGVDVRLQGVVVGNAGALSAVVPAAAPPGTYSLEARVNGTAAGFDGFRLVPGGMQVHFVDIGQGDGSLVVAPTGEVLLLDGGPRDGANAMKNAIATLGGGRVDAVVLSHTDSDHLGALVAVLAGADGIAGTNDDLVPAQRFTYVDDGSCDSGLCAEARRLLAWPFTVAHPGDKIALGDVDVTIVAADGDVGDGKIASTDTDNERSVAVRASFGGRSVIIAGDLTGGGNGDADVEGPLSVKTGPIDLLRIDHHGSATSSNGAALARWQPRALVMSVGTDNAYCHPAPEALAHLATVAAPIYATGSGMLNEGDRCGGGATVWPSSARVGLGTITWNVASDGSMTLAGDPL